MNEAELRDEICRVGRSLFERGYVHATAGNISVRLPDGFLITPTDACLGRLLPGRLARVDAQGVQTGGDPASPGVFQSPHHRSQRPRRCAAAPPDRNQIPPAPRPTLRNERHHPPQRRIDFLGSTEPGG